ncbi:hypothetical protein [Sinorhizobium sojae]|nr:hypothetical protein [Sinorhizobium sojae]
MATPAAAEECKPDFDQAKEHFDVAFASIYRHQGFAWVCSPYIGDDLAQSSIVHVEGLLEDFGVSSTDATIQADELNAKARSEAAKDTELQSSDASRDEVMIACSQMMDAEYQKFRVDRVKMRKALCR